MNDSLAKALGWLDANAAHFAWGETQTAEGGKHALELGIALHALARPGGALASPAHELPRALYDIFSAIAERDDVRLSPPRSMQRVLLQAMLDSLLRDAGRHSPIGLEPSRAALRAGVGAHEELAAYLRMEEQMFLDWAGLDHDLPSPAALAAQSMLARRLSALRLNEAGAYQLTHDIMFLGELDPAHPAYGTTPLDRASSDSVTDTTPPRQVLADLMIVFVGEPHWDLLGELLLCWDCLDLPDDATVHACRAAFLAAQDADGSTPADGRQPAEPEVAETPDQRFRRRYHTTLVRALMHDGQARRAAASRASAPSHRTSPAGARPLFDAGRDLDWLTGQLDRAGAGAAAAICGLIVGARLCAALEPDLAAEARSLRSRAAERLDAVAEFRNAPPALLLVAFAALREDGWTAPGLERYVDQVVQVLGGVASSDPHADLAFHEKRWLLHRLGLGPEPPPLVGVEACRMIADLGVQPTDEALQSAILAAESASRYGLSPCERSGDAAEVLARHAVRLLRRDDLVRGGAAIRAAHHLSPLAASRRDEILLDLLLRQGPSGGYGHLVTAEHLPFDRDLQLHLPNTLAVLSAMAELGPGLNVYGGLSPAPAEPTRVRSSVE